MWVIRNVTTASIEECFSAMSRTASRVHCTVNDREHAKKKQVRNHHDELGDDVLHALLQAGEHRLGSVAQHGSRGSALQILEHAIDDLLRHGLAARAGLGVSVPLQIAVDEQELLQPLAPGAGHAVHGAIVLAVDILCRAKKMRVK